MGAALAFGCVGPGGGSGPSPSGSSQEPRTEPVTPAEAQRLQRVMTPLLAKMNNPISLDRVSVGVIDSPEINAANAGGGQFFVTKGLLEKANDQQLSGVLAHEIAHEDLHHVAKAQVRAVGVGVGEVILQQIFPASGVVTPLAGQLIMAKYSRNEEYAADAHGAELLQRAGMNPDIMAQTLTWLVQEEGNSPGGFFATHPGTTDRIAALRNNGR